MADPCIPPQGQMFSFPPTGGPILVLAGATVTRRQYINRCGPPCMAPKLPQHTIAFFAPPPVAPPYNPPLPPSPPPPEPPEVSVGNDEQTCSDTCPEGTTGEFIEITVPANTFFRGSKEAANAAALADACAQVASLRAASPCLVPAAAAVAIYCQNRFGTPGLIGCAEYQLVSIPTKYYRRVRVLGGSTLHRFNGPNGTCTGTPDIVIVCFVDATQQWNALTGAVTITGSNMCDGVDAGLPPDLCFVGIPANTCDTQWTVSPTLLARFPTGACCSWSILGSQTSVSDNLTNFLEDEDTEQAAIDRFRLATPYSAFSLCAFIPSVPNVGPLACCESLYQARVGGTSFDYKEARARIEAADLTPGSTYLIRCIIRRTDIDTLASVISGFHDTVDVASAGGTITDEFEMSNLRGYKFVIETVEAYLLS